jgi:hypothetical protein
MARILAAAAPRRNPGSGDTAGWIVLVGYDMAGCRVLLTVAPLARGLGGPNPAGRAVPHVPRGKPGAPPGWAFGSQGP